MAKRYWANGAQELARGHSPTLSVRALRRYLPDLQSTDLNADAEGTGIRAQALGADGSLIDDFLILEEPDKGVRPQRTITRRHSESGHRPHGQRQGAGTPVTSTSSERHTRIGSLSDENLQGDLVDHAGRLPVFVGPDLPQAVVTAVEQGGACVVTDPQAAQAVVWTGKDVQGLMTLLHSGVRWVQLPDAGGEPWLAAGILDNPRRLVTSARGCYGPQVAEHALALLLAGARRLAVAARTNAWPEERTWGTTLRGRNVVVVGAGDVGGHLIQMLAPLGACTVAVTRRGLPVRDAAVNLPVHRLDEALQDAAALVVAAPATPKTLQLIGAQQIDGMAPGAVLVNVARGNLVDSRALLAALDSGQLSAAALDVTDPEPLPIGHPLWTHPGALITPHVANPPEAKERALAGHVRENTHRFVHHQELLSVVDADRGY